MHEMIEELLSIQEHYFLIGDIELAEQIGLEIIGLIE